MSKAAARRSRSINVYRQVVWQVLVCVLLWLGSNQASAEPLKILFVGDSITAGGNRARDESSYRLPLQTLVATTGVAVDYVGTRDEGLHADAKWPAGFDPHHEAYYGATTAFVRDQLREHIDRFAPPDIALIHLGTNDRGSSSDFIEPLEQIIDLLRSRNPRVVVLVGHLNVHDWAAPWRRLRVNRMVSRMSSSTSPVVAVNHFEDWVEDPRRVGTDTWDWIHPNPRGQSQMALTWFAALRPYLREVHGPI